MCDATWGNVFSGPFSFVFKGHLRLRGVAKRCVGETFRANSLSISLLSYQGDITLFGSFGTLLCQESSWMIFSPLVVPRVFQE